MRRRPREKRRWDEMKWTKLTHIPTNRNSNPTRPARTSRPPRSHAARRCSAEVIRYIYPPYLSYIYHVQPCINQGEDWDQDAKIYPPLAVPVNNNTHTHTQSALFRMKEPLFSTSRSINQSSPNPVTYFFQVKRKGRNTQSRAKIQGPVQ